MANGLQGYKAVLAGRLIGKDANMSKHQRKISLAICRLAKCLFADCRSAGEMQGTDKRLRGRLNPGAGTTQPFFGRDSHREVVHDTYTLA